MSSSAVAKVLLLRQTSDAVLALGFAMGRDSGGVVESDEWDKEKRKARKWLTELAAKLLRRNPTKEELEIIFKGF